MKTLRYQQTTNLSETKNVEIKTRLTKMGTLTKNVAKHSYYKCLDFHKVQTSIRDLDHGENVWKILSLTGVPIKQGYIVPCHRLKIKAYVIIKRTPKKV